MITITRTDPSDVPTYRHFEISKSSFEGNDSANITAVTPSPSTTWSILSTEELRDFEIELSSALLPVPALFDSVFVADLAVFDVGVVAVEPGCSGSSSCPDANWL